MELGDTDPSRAPSIDHRQFQVIKNHLAMVFKHEIDPSMGPPAKQAELDALHKPPFHPGAGPLARC